MLYESINNPKIKQLKQLKQKKYRDKESLFLVETEKIIKEAYKNGYLKELFIKKGIDINIDIKKNFITDKVSKYLSDMNTSQGIFGLCEKKQMKLKEGKILILDGIQDPGNMGTIIRSSVAFNIDTIVINDKCVDPYNPKVVKASEGMIFSANIIKTDLMNFIKTIEKSHKIYSTNVKNGKNIKDIENTKKFAIIMGSEGNGVSKELLDISENLYIPMNKKCESLNVGVATSIFLFYLGGE